MIRIIDCCKIKIDGFQCDRGTVQTQEIDLTPYQGQMVRIFLDNNLKLVVNPQYDCYWQLAEVMLPPVKVTQREKGIIQEEYTEEIYVIRGDGEIDEVSGLGTGEIISAGFSWCNFQKNVDYQQVSTGIKWIGERSPQAGEEYPVVVRRTREKIEYENVVEPLDLTKTNITFFDLPGGVR